ncbi:uncharacterized protein LOC129235226 [Uloborus diversus]|uniref:uncharacterized protein LOC129235226 n=1 Tax=Uloborus diversus TaxID=327109 RepID=UPI00240A3789|nr:uncharacterized protein LOC129235226 [Uloborus diversus]
MVGLVVFWYGFLACFEWDVVLCEVECFTCSVDFRSQPFQANNSCLFPRDHDEKARCSRVSKYCQGSITRISGVFVQFIRSCETDCHETCVEKGYGIETSDCRYCCNESVPNSARCGFQGYKSTGTKLKNTSTFLLLLCSLLIFPT